MLSVFVGTSLVYCGAALKIGIHTKTQLFGRGVLTNDLLRAPRASARAERIKRSSREFLICIGFGIEIFEFNDIQCFI